MGSASLNGTALRLTSAQRNCRGAAWFREKQPIRAGFETTFRFQLTQQGGLGHGADGFAFVLQNSGPDALGGNGSGGGFAIQGPGKRRERTAIPWSIAVFFDTFRNRELGDPSDNYISLCTFGRPVGLPWPAPRLAFTPKLAVQLRDQNVHAVRIVFRPPVLSVFLDNFDTPVLETPVDLSIVLDRTGSAWVGFTASTGWGWQNHDILSWSFSSTAVDSSISAVDSDISFPLAACLPGRNLCTPEHAIVERNGSGYHVVLPANLEWGATIANPAGRRLTITNAHGFVCWDVKTRGTEGCSGPSGNGAAAGPGFLAPDTAPGTLIEQTRDGHAIFSVNGRPGAFSDNEGFYEFDLVP